MAVLCPKSSPSSLTSSLLQSSSHPPISPFEAEHIVGSLKCFTPEEFGTEKWFEQHEQLERLNLQAHQQANGGTDEFIMETFSVSEKIPLLIHELILTEMWKEKLFPLMKTHLATLSSLQSYIPLFHEATIINLLQLLLYHRTAAESANEYLVDLVDYCYRKLTYLMKTPNDSLYATHLTPIEIANLTDEEELSRQKLDCEFAICMCVISVIRFLADHRPHLPVTVTSRFLDHHDILLTLVPLLEKQPWCRRNKRGEQEIFKNQMWMAVKEEDIGSTPQIQIQVWLTIYNLVMDQEYRNRYEITHFRRENLLRLRKYLNEVVYDQIPPLVDLHRVLEELSIGGSGCFSSSGSSALPIIVELLADIRSKLEKQYDGKWKEVAAIQKKDVFTRDRNYRNAKRLAELFANLPDEVAGDAKCAKCGKEADKRCSKCRSELYCSRDCQVKDWKTHKPLCRLLSEKPPAS